jgi:hypothetical protein
MKSKSVQSTGSLVHRQLKLSSATSYVKLVTDISIQSFVLTIRQRKLPVTMMVYETGTVYFTAQSFYVKYVVNTVRHNVGISNE